MKLLMGSDHGGIHLKKHLAGYLTAKGYEIIDVGTDSEASCDYPDFAAKLCGEIAKGTATKGILVCGTGIGISIAANKCKGIRAAVCNDVDAAIVIFDANGKTLWQETTAHGPWFQLPDELPAGVYFVWAEDCVTKFVK